jgi:hypothetical protein
MGGHRCGAEAMGPGGTAPRDAETGFDLRREKCARLLDAPPSRRFRDGLDRAGVVAAVAFLELPEIRRTVSLKDDPEGSRRCEIVEVGGDRLDAGRDQQDVHEVGVTLECGTGSDPIPPSRSRRTGLGPVTRRAATEIVLDSWHLPRLGGQWDDRHAGFAVGHDGRPKITPMAKYRRRPGCVSNVYYYQHPGSRSMNG